MILVVDLRFKYLELTYNVCADVLYSLLSLQSGVFYILTFSRNLLDLHWKIQFNEKSKIGNLAFSNVLKNLILDARTEIQGGPGGPWPPQIFQQLLQ